MTGENVVHAKALLEQIREDILEQLRPPILNENDPQSTLHKREESFERLCFQLRKNNIASPESLSTYSFYMAILMLKEENDTKLTSQAS